MNDNEFVFILNDSINWDEEVFLFPSYIISKNFGLINVFSGKPLGDNDKPSKKLFKEGFYGIYVRNRDLNNINHERPYIFIDTPDVNEFLKNPNKKEFCESIWEQIEEHEE